MLIHVVRHHELATEQQLTAELCHDHEHAFEGRHTAAPAHAGYRLTSLNLQEPSDLSQAAYLVA